MGTKKTKRLKTKQQAHEADEFYMLMPTEAEQMQSVSWQMELWLAQWNTLLVLASTTHGLKTKFAVVDAFATLRNTTIQLYNTCDEFGLQSVGKEIVNLTDEMNGTVNQYINNPSTKTLSQIWIAADNKRGKLTDLVTKVHYQWD